MKITTLQIDAIVAQINQSLYSILQNNDIEITEKILVDEFISKFCDSAGVKFIDVISRNREMKIKTCRFVISYFLYTRYKLTYVAISKILGGLDHSTIVHQVATSRNFIENRDEYFLTFYNIALNCFKNDNRTTI